MQGSLSTNVLCVCTDAEPINYEYFAISTLLHTIAEQYEMVQGVSFQFDTTKQETKNCKVIFRVGCL